MKVGMDKAVQEHLEGKPNLPPEAVNAIEGASFGVGMYSKYSVLTDQQMADVLKPVPLQRLDGGSHIRKFHRS